jgi:Protein kinase domain
MSCDDPLAQPHSIHCLCASPSLLYIRAPEVMQQIQQGYDCSIDIWSLGITALELAMGYAPYAKYPPMKVLIRTIQEDPPSLQTYRHEQQDQQVRASSRKAGRGDGTGAGATDGDPQHEPPMPHPSPDEFTQAFEAFVDACLQKDPAKRPTCADLLRQHLVVNDEAERAQRRQQLVEQVLNVVPTVGEGKVSSRSRAPSRQHRGSAAGAATGAAAAAAPAVDSSSPALPSSASGPSVPEPRAFGQHVPSSNLAVSPAAPSLSSSDPVPEAVRDRQPGTTWVFADAASSHPQDGAIGEGGGGDDEHANTSLDSTAAALLEEEDDHHDVLQALDEFERQTGGENYYGREEQHPVASTTSLEPVNEADETVRAKPRVPGTMVAAADDAVATAAHPPPARYGDEGGDDDVSNNNNNSEIDAEVGASAESLVSPPAHRTDSKDSHNNSTDEDLSAFMDEFELHTAGEDFRREDP